jgi:hypothetical protein
MILQMFLAFFEKTRRGIADATHARESLDRSYSLEY